MKTPLLVRLALGLLPRDFRAAHTEELEEFVARELEASGHRRRLVVAKIAADLARSAVRLRLRPVRKIRGPMTAEAGEGWLAAGLADARFASRGLVRSPGFTAVVVMTLGLGIGLNTAIFSVVNAVLLRPLDYAESERLVYLEGSLPANGLDDVGFSGGDLRDLQQVSAFEALEGIARIRQNLSGAGLPRQVEVGWVSGGFLSMLGVKPELGRLHREGDLPGKVVLGHSIWHDALGADPSVVGRTIKLDGYPYEVIGVLPESFRLRLPGAGEEEVRPEVWKNPDAFWQNGDMWRAQGPEFALLRLVGRLGGSHTAGTAREAVEPAAQDLRARFDGYRTGGFQIGVDPLQDRVVERVRPTLTLLLGAVSFVLLIACANVANLLLVRGRSRRREIAVRMSLGSSGGRVGRFLLVESVILAFLGSTAGLLVALQMVSVVPLFAPPQLPRLDEIGVDWTVLLFAVLAAVTTAVLVGLLPAIVSARTDPADELGNGRSLETGSARLRDGLVVAQVALSIMLLVGAGLLTQSLVRTQKADPGFDTAGLFTFGVSIPGAQYGWPEEADRFYRTVEARVADLPGVERAGVVWPMPFSGTWAGEHATNEGERLPLGEVEYRLATESYFPTAKIPLVSGRHFREGDQSHVVIVSEVVAERTWPGANPIGRRLEAQPWGPNEESFEVIGVVGDVRNRDVRTEPAGTLYFDSRAWSWVDWEVHFLVRADRDEASLLPDVRAALAEIDGAVPLARPSSMEVAIQRQTATERFVLALLALFATTAVILALVGLYGVVSYSVGMRSREFGLRLAVGAARGGIQWMVVRRGVGLALIGVALGLAGARALSGVLEAFLYGVTPGDVSTYAGVALLLAAGTIGATWLPAWRAGRLDPVEVLGTE